MSNDWFLYKDSSKSSVKLPPIIGIKNQICWYPNKQIVTQILSNDSGISQKKKKKTIGVQINGVHYFNHRIYKY